MWKDSALKDVSSSFVELYLFSNINKKTNGFSFLARQANYKSPTEKYKQEKKEDSEKAQVTG